MNNMIIFAGTTEGRILAERFSKENIRIHISVATDYGDELIEKHDNVVVKAGRMDACEMTDYISDIMPLLVIDATHPYAVDVSKNIRTACENTDAKYIRLLREKEENYGDCIFVSDSSDAAKYLDSVTGNILLTVGSKDLSKYTNVRGYRERLFVRMLPSAEMIDAAKSLGFASQNLICMQGPFSREFNAQMMREINAKVIVTKDSGDIGGIKAKIDAARDIGARVVMIRRPSDEVGYSFDEVCSIVEKEYKIEKKKRITIVAAGMGRCDNMTGEALRALESAELLIGAPRLLEGFSDGKRSVCEAVSADDIVNIINKTEAHSIAVLMSGDVSFYSGAKRLLPRLSSYDVQMISGVSSVSYFASKIGVSYDDAKIISEHGRYGGLVSAVRKNKKTFVLSGGRDGALSILERLVTFGLSHVFVTVGENLSYENERIVKGRAEELLKEDFSPLCVMYIENTSPEIRTPGWDDTMFIRTDVPMTKSEVRAVVISKLKLMHDSVCWDVGAGSGSVSLEMADIAYLGNVYAIERNETACDLIEKNKRYLGIENVEVIKGYAPDALNDLVAPTHVFIGGSGGNMGKIIDAALSKNPNIRIVINTVTAESFADAVTYLKKTNVKDMEIVQINISKGRRVGEYNLMTAQNPVFVISCTGGGVRE